MIFILRCVIPLIQIAVNGLPAAVMYCVHVSAIKQLIVKPVALVTTIAGRVVCVMKIVACVIPKIPSFLSGLLVPVTRWTVLACVIQPQPAIKSVPVILIA